MTFDKALERYEMNIGLYTEGFKTLPKTYEAMVKANKLYIMPFKDVDASGKMHMVPALGTISFPNDKCKERARMNVGICRSCYVSSSMNLGPEMLNLTHNFNMLSGSILQDDVIETTANELVKLATKGITKGGTYYPPSYKVRIEAKGDTINALQAYNYNMIAKRVKEINPEISVTAWTKNPDDYEKAFRMSDGNKYLRLVYSAFETDEAGVMECKRIKAYYGDMIDVYFVCYHGGKAGANTEADGENEASVKARFGAAAIACKCVRGSCGHICGACYDENNHGVTVFENVRG